MIRWTSADIPDQSGRVAIVTGSNSGIGYESARELARKKATVIMGVRSMERGETAAATIRKEISDADLHVMKLDLGDLSTVRSFVDDFRNQHQRLDILMNNAGMMAPPFDLTKDGFELQMGINHLGHFALTGLLLDLLLSTAGSRVVNVSSGAHRQVRTIKFDDMHSDADYSRYGRYSETKLANVLFTLELHRRLQAINADVASLAAHPGFTNSNLQRNTVSNSGAGWEARIYSFFRATIMQSQEWGAFPQLYAATAPDAKSGEFYGPALATIRGYPRVENPSKASRDEALAKQLWDVSEEQTGVTFTALQPQSA